MNYSQEELFLFKASKLFPQKFRIKSLDNKIDLNKLMELARINLLLPLIYSRLSQIPGIKSKLYDFESTYHSLKMKAIARQMEYDFLLKEAKKYSLDFIPLKGMFLSRTLYEESGLREMIDIDILAKYEDVIKWHDFFKKNNYIEVHNDKNVKADLLPLLSDKDVRLHVDDVKLLRGNSVLEIHFRLLSLKITDQLTNEELWNNSIVEELGGLKLTTLCPEHQLINLSTHCTYHNFGFGLRSISEIDGLISYYGNRINWDKFYSCVDNCNLTKLVYVPLYLAKQFYDSLIPEELISKIETKCGSFWRNLSLKIKEDYFKRHEIPILQDSSLFLQIISQSSWLKSLKRIFIPSKRMIELKTNAKKGGFFFIYSQYPLRFVHLFKTFFGKIVKSMFNTYKMIYGRNSKTD